VFGERRDTEAISTPPQSSIALLQITGVNIVLSGDNSVVIALDLIKLIEHPPARLPGTATFLSSATAAFHLLSRTISSTCTRCMSAFCS